MISMRRLLASTCLTPFALIAVAGAAHAETTVTTARTTGAATSTINNGAADDIRITSAGSIVPTTGVAVTVDSANKVTNEGKIQITGANGAVGIQANAGTSGGISNTGTITIDENYTAEDSDKDGDLDGPLATGSNRFGIRTLGAYSGNIVNGAAGTISVEGKDSAGISLGTSLNGSLTNDGTIAVVGDRSVGISTGDVSGSVRLAGSIGARGQNASAAVIGGDIGGALVVQGTLVASGYRSTTAPSDTSKLDADDLLQGGPALSVGGNVAGGIVLAVPPKDNSTTDNDEDKDGIDDAKEGSAAVASYGAAAAVRIGATDRAVTIGAVAGAANGHGLVIDGGVIGSGVYSGIDGNAVVIGGLGGAVSIAGGMTVNGSVQAQSNGATATAIRVGAAATVPEIRVGGGVSASGKSASGIVVDAGGAVGTIRNSGTIRATATADGTANAIVDRAGTVSLVETSGTIAASGASAADRNVAIDLSANGGGATVRQLAPASGTATPSISGDVRFGGGNDLFEIAAGNVAGNVSFGGGSDAMSLAGSSSFSGTADFGGGANTLTLAGSSIFSGKLANAQGLAVTVSGGRLDLGTGTTAIGSLSVGAQGVLGVTIGATANTLFQVGGDAIFADGAKVAVRFDSIAAAEGQHVFLRAGSVSGGDKLTSANTLLPFLYKSSIVASAPNELAIDVSRKTATELGLNRSQASAYNAVYTALGKDAEVAGAYLDIMDGDRFRRTLRQMLPDHAGGTFEAVTSGSRATARILADPNAPFSDQGKWGFWLQQVAWGTSKSLGDTGGYDITGWGVAGGAEAITDLGHFGLGLGYLHGKDADGGTSNEVSDNQYELSGYWRGQWGGFNAHARVSAARVDFEGQRHFDGAIGGESVERTARGDWNGTLWSASGGASYAMRLGRLSLRPIAAVDYYRLKEKGYGETGGGDAFNLIVDGRTSDELAVTGSLAAGLMFGGTDPDAGWFRLELEGGRRQIVGGSLGETTARFTGGEAFTLVPEDRTNGWVGRFRADGGNGAFRVSSEFSAEEQQGRAALALRVGLQIGI